MATTKLKTDADVDHWLQEVADSLVARADGKRSNNQKRNPQKNGISKTSKSKHENDLADAMERSVALSTTADVKGVSFKGRAMQKLYYQTKFVRRGRLIYNTMKELFASKNLLPDQEKLVVSCIGGGPGNDAAGVVAANCSFLGYLPNRSTGSCGDIKNQRNKVSLKQAHEMVRVARSECEEARAKKEACERRLRKAVDASDDARIRDCTSALDKNAAALEIATKVLDKASAHLAKLREARQQQQVENVATPLSQHAADSTNRIDESQTLQIHLLDFEAQWRSYESTLSAHFAPHHAGVTFNTCDVTKPIFCNQSNSVSESCLSNTDLYIFCYVCNETSAAASANEHQFYVDLVRAAKTGAVFLFCDVQGYSRQALEDVFGAMNKNVDSGRSVIREPLTEAFQKHLRSQIMLLRVVCN